MGFYFTAQLSCTLKSECLIHPSNYTSRIADIGVGAPQAFGCCDRVFFSGFLVAHLRINSLHFTTSKEVVYHNSILGCLMGICKQVVFSPQSQGSDSILNKVIFQLDPSVSKDNLKLRVLIYKVGHGLTDDTFGQYFYGFLVDPSFKFF